MKIVILDGKALNPGDLSYDSLKQFGPEENQLFDGTAIQARYLYDLVVPSDKVITIGALVSA